MSIKSASTGANPYQQLLAKQQAKLDKAAEHANYLLDTFLPYSNWTFVWHDKIRALGTCHYGRMEIALSKRWTLATPWHEVDDTLRHEVAHAIAGRGTNHGLEWQRVAVTVGAKPVTTYTGDITSRDVAPAKYEMVTPDGVVIKSYFRKPAAKTYRNLQYYYQRGNKAATIGKLEIRAVCMIEELGL